MRPMMRNGLVYGRRKENSGTDESLERIGRWLMRRGRVGEFRHGEGKRRRLERSSDARSFSYKSSPSSATPHHFFSYRARTNHGSAGLQESLVATEHCQRNGTPAKDVPDRLRP